MSTKSIIYLDNNATTPMDERIAEKFYKLCQEFWANPSSLHASGQKAQQELLESRERIASCLGGASRDEIYFTSGATESNNLFLRGILKTLPKNKQKLLTSTIEHPAVLNVFQELEKDGFIVDYLPVDAECLISLEELEKRLTNDVGLVSIMAANNETGAIQPTKEIGQLCKKVGALFFVDAVQAVGKIPLDVKELGVHGLSFSGHKFYGPKGIGGFYLDASIKLPAVAFGGHQERGIRPGTENVPGISAMSWAMLYACKEQQKTHQKLKKLKEKIIQHLTQFEGVRINGSLTHALVNTINVAIEGVNGESLIVNLDLRDIAVSTGSACSSGATEPSHVLMAMGITKELCKSSIRISLGKQNTEEEVEVFLQILPSCVERLRKVAI